MPQCTAKSKRSGERCRNQAVTGCTVCRMHGGRSLKGLDHPAYKGGKYSKHLPARMLEDYHNALDGPDIIGLTSEILLIDTRLTDVLDRVNSGESGQRWKNAASALENFRKGTQRGDRAAMFEAVIELSRIFGSSSDYSSWEEVKRLLTLRDRLCSSEVSRRSMAQRLVTIDQLGMLMLAIEQSVREVAGRDAAAKVHEKLVAIGHRAGRMASQTKKEGV